MAGFTSGEGSFMVDILKSKTTKLGEQVKLVYKLTQHNRDEQLMRSLIQYFGCGGVHTHGDILEFKVTRFTDIVNKIIPFFKKHKIVGVKYKDFEDWCQVAELMKEKTFNKKNLTATSRSRLGRLRLEYNK